MAVKCAWIAVFQTIGLGAVKPACAAELTLAVTH